MISILDLFYSRFANRNTFFRGGWGDEEGLTYLLQQNPKNVHDRPVNDISIQWKTETKINDYRIRDGYFESPFYFEYQIGRRKKIIRLPEESKIAHVQLILPRDFLPSSPLVIHFAATGDEGFARRRLTMALPLAKKGYGSLLLENPFYGIRKPKGQAGVYIRTFTDFLAMSRAATDEGIAILEYFRRQGHQNLGVTGISMGGYTSLTTAARSRLTLAVAACVPCHSGAPVYLEGALSRSCAWEKLESNFLKIDMNARTYMKKILDQSDIRFFPKPNRSDKIIIVGAKSDAYIPKYSTELIHQHLPEARVKWIPSGHVGSLLFYAKNFREAIAESFSIP